MESCWARPRWAPTVRVVARTWRRRASWWIRRIKDEAWVGRWGVRHQVGARGRLSQRAVQRGRRDEHRGGPSMAVARLPDPRHRCGGVRPPSVWLGWPPCDVSTPLLDHTWG